MKDYQLIKLLLVVTDLLVFTKLFLQNTCLEMIKYIFSTIMIFFTLKNIS